VVTNSGGSKRAQPFGGEGLAKFQKDFTVGSIPKHLVTFAMPMFLGSLLQGLYSTVDSIWVGRYLGAQALGAVSVSMPIVFGMVSMVMGLTMASTTMISQYRGARMEKEVHRTVTNSLMLITVLGICVAIVGILVRYPVLRLINTPTEILDDAADYLGIFLAGTVFAFLYNAGSAILRGVGDSRNPVIFMAYATVINIILDPLMIIGVGPFPRMGIAGAALATMIAQAVSAFLTLRHLRYKTDLMDLSRENLRLEKRLVKQLLKIGLPAGVQQTVVSFANIVVASVINHFGPIVVAAHGAAARLDQFSFMPAQALSLSVSVLVGQNLGADKSERVKDVVKWGSIITTGITGAVTLIAFFAPRILMQLFTGDESVLSAGSEYLRIMCFSYIPFALIFIFSGVMRGAGNTLPSMLLTFTSLWLIRVPLVNLLALRLGLGSRGIWIGIVISAVMGMCFNYLYYRSGRWKRSKVVQKPPVNLEPV